VARAQQRDGGERDDGCDPATVTAALVVLTGIAVVVSLAMKEGS